MSGLQERRERNVVEAPHQKGPDRAANERGQYEAPGFHKQPVKDYRGAHSGDRPHEVERIALGYMPLKVASNPRCHKKAYCRIGCSSRKAPCGPLDVL